MHRQPDQVSERVLPPASAMASAAATGPIRLLADFLDEVRDRAAGARSWLESSEHYAELLNSAGFVPVTARFDARDLMFLGRAREDLLAFTDLVGRLAELHRPLDAGGISSDPANRAMRCHSCMSRWPCPTFRLMTGILTGHRAL